MMRWKKQKRVKMGRGINPNAPISRKMGRRKGVKERRGINLFADPYIPSR